MKLSTIAGLLVSTAMACNHENIARQAECNDTSLPFNYIPGNDPPADPATQSYFINHVAIMVSDINRTREWYSNVLGMRHIFTFEMSPEYTIMYMGHSQGGKNGTGYQTGAEMGRDKNNMAGLVEFQHYTASANRTYEYQNPRTTFSHFGLIVDDVEAAQARFESMEEVRIIKRAGELDLSGDTEESRMFGGAWGFDDMKSEEARKHIENATPALEMMGFKGFLIIADPDSNMFEIQGQVGAAI